MTSVIHSNSMIEMTTTSITTQPILRPSKSADTNTTTMPLDTIQQSTVVKIPASLVNIKKLLEKQQNSDQLYKQYLVCSTDEEKDLIETIDTVKTRCKLLDSEFKNRPLFWHALCQSYPQHELADFYDKATIEINHDLEPMPDSVLRIASLYAAHHTYYQGMAYLIEPLVSIMSEKEAYCIFVRLLELHEIPSMYQHINDRVHDVEIMLKHTCPDLCFDHVRSFVESSLRGACISPSLLDILLLEGYTETMMKYVVMSLQLHQDILVSLDATATTQYLQEMRVPARAMLAVKRRAHVGDLVYAFSQLQRDHEVLSQEHMQLKIKEMNDEQTQAKLIKRNAVLEKRLKKYKTKLATATTTMTMEEDKNKSFVETLRETGDFGALIAGALAPPSPPPPPQEQEDETLQNVTSELVAIKLAHFETQQKYEQLQAHCDQLEERLRQQQHVYEQTLQKTIYLQNELEDTQIDRDQLIEEQEQVAEMAMVAKKTLTELQTENLQLVKQVEQLDRAVQRLEHEKQNYFMPRDSFAEEVFAAHSILFSKPMETVIEDGYKDKYVESELRCRELEKYLAETKVRLAELESNAMATPRTSYASRRTSLIQTKRTSAASLSMLAHRASTASQRRESSESFASSTTSVTSMNSSQYNSKRSSALYSRIWNAFGPTPKPLCDEPQIIEPA